MRIILTMRYGRRSVMNDKSEIERMKKTENYFPITNPDELDEETKISIPSDEDLKNAKKWVDEVEK